MHLISEGMLQLLHNITLTDNWPPQDQFLTCLEVKQQQPSFLCHHKVRLLPGCHQGREHLLAEEVAPNKKNLSVIAVVKTLLTTKPILHNLDSFNYK